MILPEDKKMLFPPPPPYEEIVERRPTVPHQSNRAVTQESCFTSLPSHILLQIVYLTFPQTDGQFEGEGKVERQRETLFWLETSLRLVNRALYITSMYVLRSTYLPAYTSLVKPPYTSDPFPSSDTSQGSILEAGNRELRTLDLFIALLAHEDFLLDSTSLHLPREEAYKDLFDLMQPRSRLEDLVLQAGSSMGLITSQDTADEDNTVTVPSSLAPSSSAMSSSTPPTPTTPSSPAPLSKSSFNPLNVMSSFREKKKMKKPPPPTPFTPERPAAERIRPVPSSYISVSLTPRTAKLLYSDTGSRASTSMGLKKTLVEIDRSRDEPLEGIARRLLSGLQEVLEVTE